MSPRRARRRREEARPLRENIGEQAEIGPDGRDWLVRRITGSSSTKNYRCPGCDQEIRPATPHVVAWPADALDERRHWHSACWDARGRRGVTGRRA